MIDSSQAGGILAAVGSHYIDTLRWWFGEIHWAAGAVSTAVDERMVTGRDEMRRVDADDNTAFILRFASGALGTVQISYTSSTEIGEEIIATGSEGTLAIHDDGRLYGSRHGEPIRSLYKPPEPTSTNVGRVALDATSAPSRSWQANGSGQCAAAPTPHRRSRTEPRCRKSLTLSPGPSNCRAGLTSAETSGLSSRSEIPLYRFHTSRITPRH